MQQWPGESCPLILFLSPRQPHVTGNSSDAMAPLPSDEERKELAWNRTGIELPHYSGRSGMLGVRRQRETRKKPAAHAFAPAKCWGTDSSEGDAQFAMSV